MGKKISRYGVIVLVNDPTLSSGCNTFAHVIRVMYSTRLVLMFLGFWQLFAVALALPQTNFELNNQRIQAVQSSSTDCPGIFLGSKGDDSHSGFPLDQPIKPSETENDSEVKEDVKLRPHTGQALPAHILLYFFFKPTIQLNELVGTLSSIPLYKLFHSWKSYLI